MTDTQAPSPDTGLLRAVYRQEGEHRWRPGPQSRGPWDPRAQHGGAPSALMVHLAEQAMAEPGWQLGRITVELVRPVPLAPLDARVEVARARSTARVTVELWAGDALVARGHALLQRRQDLALPAGMPGWTPARLLPPPEACSERVRIPGLAEGVSFYWSAMETRVAQGDPGQPGASAAWFRLALPFVEGAATSAAMRAVAAADFGNGLSWVLPVERYLFTNADLSVHLHRSPVGEWIGLASQTQMDASGCGTAMSQLFDEEGSVGVAVQTLALRARA